MTAIVGLIQSRYAQFATTEGRMHIELSDARHAVFILVSQLSVLDFAFVSRLQRPDRTDRLR